MPRLASTEMSANQATARAENTKNENFPNLPITANRCDWEMENGVVFFGEVREKIPNPQ